MRPTHGGHTNVAPTVDAEDARPTDAAPPVEPERWARLAFEVLDALEVAGPAELSLSFVDADTIAALNAEHLGGDGPTDVLSFPLDVDAPDEPASQAPRMLGDIVICPSVAAANAPEHAGTLDDELALLVVHGVLHVLGHDHAEPDEAREMRAIEADLLARFHGPVAAGTEIPQAEAHP
jgi:probable rRNA maturation factor